MVPEGWTIDSFTSLIVRAAPRAIPKAKKSTYKEHGSFPVIDQGQAKVAGYVDDETLLFPGVLPVVVFGDHSRAFKYVDFPFVAGADGTQILRADTSKLDPRFFFYAVSALPLRNLGYSRHFKLLKEQRVACPPLPEQRKIVAILSSVDDAIEKTQVVIDQVGVVKKGLMQELLTRGLPGRHKKFKPLANDWRQGRVQSGLEVIPEAWQLVPLTSVARLESGHTPSRRKSEYWNGDVPWISLHDTKRLDAPSITETEQKITEEGLRNSSARLLPAGTVVFSRTATVGKCTIMGRSMSTSQDFANYVCGPSLHNRYLMHLFRHMQSEWTRLMAGSAHKTVYMPVFRELQILLPPFDEQKRIASVADVANQRVEREWAKVNQFELVKRGLMSVLLTGQVRVSPDSQP